MKRREFIALLGSCAVASPFTASAQQAPVPVIGFLNGTSPEEYAPMLAAFHRGLKEAGYVEGQNVQLEYRWANGQYDRLPLLAEELVRLGVSVIAATSTPANLAAKAATTKIPVVFTAGNDPIQLGLVSSLSRPAGNVTGVTQMTVQVAPKRVELAHELTPSATTLGLLINPTNPSSGRTVRDSEAAAKTLGLRLHVLRASTKSELETAFRAFGQIGWACSYWVAMPSSIASLKK